MEASIHNEELTELNDPRPIDSLLAYACQEKPGAGVPQASVQATESKITEAWNKIKANPAADTFPLEEHIHSLNETISLRKSKVNEPLLPQEKLNAEELFSSKEAKDLYSLELSDPIAFLMN